MKKGFLIFAALAILLSLWGCTEERPQPAGQTGVLQQLTVTDAYSDWEGILIQADSVCTYPDKTELIIVWSNRTDCPAEYSGGFWLERLENGSWVRLQLDSVYNAIAGSLSPGEMDNKTYVAADGYNLATPGTYRFFGSCSIDTGNGAQTLCDVWTEYVIAP